ncbi:unnamed protein product [Amoebophrya sp. A120]|nr:unnamed protein product [Amoebophrya sp. A120]|eukprot:GSA120T00020453001.1
MIALPLFFAHTLSVAVYLSSFSKITISNWLLFSSR